MDGKNEIMPGQYFVETTLVENPVYFHKKHIFYFRKFSSKSHF